MTSDYQGRQRRRLTATVTDLDVVTQKAYLVSVELLGVDLGDVDRSLAELELLTDTAGSEPVGAVVLKRRVPSPATFIGEGQARELAAETTALDVDVVVFDNDLTPAQQRNLQKIFKVRRRGSGRTDPRHLRPARDEPGGHAPGRAGTPPATTCRGCVAAAPS